MSVALVARDWIDGVHETIQPIAELRTTPAFGVENAGAEDEIRTRDPVLGVGA